MQHYSPETTQSTFYRYTPYEQPHVVYTQEEQILAAEPIHYDLPYPYQWRTETIDELILEGLRREQQELSSDIEDCMKRFVGTSSNRSQDSVTHEPGHEKQLVFEGYIKRKNNKTQPQDHFVIQFSMK
jgi:hypothetical protein